jgi:DnaK suppressor protein
MNNTHFKQKLLDKQRELENEITRMKGEIQPSDGDEVKDATDSAEADQETSDTTEAAGILTHTLEDVRDALRRIEDGSYGKCAACGKPIEPARLEAVPWTLYCLKDQEKREARQPFAQGSTL